MMKRTRTHTHTVPQRYFFCLFVIAGRVKGVNVYCNIFQTEPTSVYNMSVGRTGDPVSSIYAVPVHYLLLAAGASGLRVQAV